MPKLSKERLNELKRSKNYTFKDIATNTGIPKSTIAKIFGGFNTNPTIENLQKIARTLDCTIDDFLEYDNQPSAPFYTDRLGLRISQDIQEKPELKALFDSARELHNTDIEILTLIAKRLKK